MAAKSYVIALEEHYQDTELRQHSGGSLAERLEDVGALRLREMDEAGIDLQVLSHANPGLQGVDAATGVPLARRINDRLHEAVQRHPDRFAAFAAVPTADPKAAADELERTVTRLGFKGAMINGLTSGVFHDDRRFWPLYERAAALDVPIYIHPAIPQQAVVETYYKGYVEKHPGLLRAGWGFNVETATQGIRFVLSGVFDAHPGLKVILGHMGEGLPFYLWRITHGLRQSMGETTFREIFCRHFWITTSGFFSDPALVCCMMEMGIDRILFSVDYPFVDNPPGAEWIKTLPLCAEDREKLLNGNARRLL
ncbi:MAG: amidohydrolase family protein, partial [Alphaproteobacteria bacterium]